MIANIGNRAGWILSFALFGALVVWAVLEARKNQDV